MMSPSKTIRRRLAMRDPPTVPKRLTHTAFVRYLARHRDVHRDTRGCLVDTEIYGAIERDIERLETHLWHPELPSISARRAIVPPDAILKAAWAFVALDAHVVGGDTDRALDVVGLSWVPEMYEHRVDPLKLDDAFDRLVWLPHVCLVEADRAADYLKTF